MVAPLLITKRLRTGPTDPPLDEQLHLLALHTEQGTVTGGRIAFVTPTRGAAGAGAATFTEYLVGVYLDRTT
jgi:hypothetical protein